METIIFKNIRILLLLTYITVISSQNSLEECSKIFKCINEKEYLICDDNGTGNFVVTDSTTKFCPEGKYCSEDNTIECMSLDETTPMIYINTNTKLPDIENSEFVQNDESFTTNWNKETDIENSNVVILNNDDHTESTVLEDWGTEAGIVESNNEENVSNGDEFSQSTASEEEKTEISVDNTSEKQISHNTVSNSEDDTENTSSSPSVTQNSVEENILESGANEISSTDKSSNTESQNTNTDELLNSDKNSSTEKSTSDLTTDNVESSSGATASENEMTVQIEAKVEGENNVQGIEETEENTVASNNVASTEQSQEINSIHEAATENVLSVSSVSQNSLEEESGSGIDTSQTDTGSIVPESETTVETGAESELENNSEKPEQTEENIQSGSSAPKDSTENNVSEAGAGEIDATSNHPGEISSSNESSNIVCSTEETTSNSGIVIVDSDEGTTVSENGVAVETGANVEVSNSNQGTEGITENAVTSSNAESTEHSEEINSIHDADTENILPTTSSAIQSSAEESASGIDTGEIGSTSNTPSSSIISNEESDQGITTPDSEKTVETEAGVNIENSNEVEEEANSASPNTSDVTKEGTENVDETNSVDIENCTAGELFADTTDCRKYSVCVVTLTNSSKVEKICPIDSAFSEPLGRCTRDVSSCGGPACEMPGAIVDTENSSSFYWCIKNALGTFSKYHVPCGKSSIFVPELGRCDKVINGTVSPITSTEKEALKEEKEKMKLDMKLQKEEDKFALKQQKMKAKEEKKMLKLQLKKEKLAEKMALKAMKEKTKKDKMLTKGGKAGKESSDGSSFDLFVCENEGMFPDPDNCDQYFLCAEIKLKLKKFHLKCPLGKTFDVTKNCCCEDTEGKCLTSTTTSIDG